MKEKSSRIIRENIPLGFTLDLADVIAAAYSEAHRQGVANRYGAPEFAQTVGQIRWAIIMRDVRSLAERNDGAVPITSFTENNSSQFTSVYFKHLVMLIARSEYPMGRIPPANYRQKFIEFGAPDLFPDPKLLTNHSRECVVLTHCPYREDRSAPRHISLVFPDRYGGPHHDVVNLCAVAENRGRDIYEIKEEVAGKYAIGLRPEVIERVRKRTGSE